MALVKIRRLTEKAKRNRKCTACGAPAVLMVVTQDHAQHSRNTERRCMSLCPDCGEAVAKNIFVFARDLVPGEEAKLKDEPANTVQ